MEEEKEVGQRVLCPKYKPPNTNKRKASISIPFLLPSLQANLFSAPSSSFSILLQSWLQVSHLFSLPFSASYCFFLLCAFLSLFSVSFLFQFSMLLFSSISALFSNSERCGACNLGFVLQREGICVRLEFWWMLPFELDLWLLKLICSVWAWMIQCCVCFQVWRFVRYTFFYLLTIDNQCFLVWFIGTFENGDVAAFNLFWSLTMLCEQRGNCAGFPSDF